MATLDFESTVIQLELDTIGGGCTLLAPSVTLRDGEPHISTYVGVASVLDRTVLYISPSHGNSLYRIRSGFYVLPTHWGEYLEWVRANGTPVQAERIRTE